MRFVVRLVCGLIGLALAVPANAAQSDTALTTFLSALIGNDRSKALSLVDGNVAQVDGTGPMISGGPLAGLWHKRIVEGKDVLSPTDAFATFASCNFWKLDDFDSRFSPAQGYNVVYFCPDVEKLTAVWFSIKKSPGINKIMLFNLGHLPITAPPPAAVQ